MKRGDVFLSSVIISIITGLFICGCDFFHHQDLQPPVTENSAIVKKYKSLIDLQLDYAQKGFEAASYYIDLPALDSRSLLNEPIEYERIGALLPADISGLKRIKPSNARNAVAVEISLEEELRTLAEEFEANIAAHIPDPAKALTLPYVEDGECGFLLVGNLIPYNSIEGILIIEILNAIADGADPEELYKNIAFELENGNLFENHSRAMVMTKGNSNGRWASGIVRYVWGTISDSHKTAMMAAMGTWARATGKISLLEHSTSDWWAQWQIDIYAMGVVKIENKDFKEDQTGFATYGTVGGTTYLQLKQGITGDVLKRTALHEFGHTLGLLHEHQRHDRDAYITVLKTGEDYDITPKHIEGLRLEYLRVRLGLWTISIPYPVFWKEEQVQTFGDFDFRSIMLYSDFTIKDTQAARNAGLQPGSKVPYNTSLSAQDIAAIQKIY